MTRHSLSAVLTVLVAGAALAPTALWPDASNLTNHGNEETSDAEWLLAASDAARFSAVRAVAETVAELGAPLGNDPALASAPEVTPARTMSPADLADDGVRAVAGSA